MSTTSNNIGLKVGLGILLALFLGTAFFAYKLNTEANETEAALISEKNLVMADLNNMAKQYDDVIGKNETANKELVAARERIQTLIESLKSSQNSVSSLSKYKRKYLDLEKEMNGLLKENDRLKVVNRSLATSLDSTQVQLEERSKFSKSLIEQNNELAGVVKGAGGLQTVGLKGFGVIERSSGKLIPTERARRSDKIRVCFTVAKNTLADAGDKELYVQVIDPQNNVLGLNNQVKFENQVLNYSVISRFNYENSNLDICEFVAHGADKDFEKGRYIVNVFNEKALISSSEFTLK